MLFRAIAFNVFVLSITATYAAEPTAPQVVITAAEAQANQRESDAYGRLVKANPDFRNKRMRLECDPIEDAALKEQCLVTFGN